MSFHSIGETVGRLKELEPLKAAFEISRERNHKAYLVGGTVRDLLISGNAGNDFDFAVAENATCFAKVFAEKTGGSFFVLDHERGTSRVVHGEKGFQADFSLLRGGIEKDLGRRDFTLNSMAIDVDSIFMAQAELIDPLGGQADMAKRLLRASSVDSIKEDPLRILRAFRFSVSLSFQISEDLIKMISEGVQGLDNVSAERIRSELFMILDMPGTSEILRQMDSSGALRPLFPEVSKWKGFYQGGWHAHDLFDHSLETVRMVEDLMERVDRYLPEFGGEIDDYLNEEIETEVTRRGLLKLAALLHDAGKYYTRVMTGERGRFIGHEVESGKIVAVTAAGLKLGRKASAVLSGLASNHMRMLGLSRLKEITGRAKYRFFRDDEGFAVDLLLLSLADAKATPVNVENLEKMLKIILDMTGYYFREFVKKPPAPLLTGCEVMSILSIPQGKRVGEILKSLKEAEASGKVSTKKEAVKYIKKENPALS